MYAPANRKLIRTTEYAFFELFGETLRPYAAVVAGGLEEEVEELVGGHGDFVGFEGAGPVVVSLRAYFAGWGDAGGGEGYGGFVEEELGCVRVSCGGLREFIVVWAYLSEYD